LELEGQGLQFVGSGFCFFMLGPKISGFNVWNLEFFE